MLNFDNNNNKIKIWALKCDICESYHIKGIINECQYSMLCGEPNLSVHISNLNSQFQIFLIKNYSLFHIRIFISKQTQKSPRHANSKYNCHCNLLFLLHCNLLQFIHSSMFNEI